MSACWNCDLHVENVCKPLLRRLSSYLFIYYCYIRACLCLAYILFLTQNALHQVYSVLSGTVFVAEYVLYFSGLLTVKSSCFLYLLAIKWPYICQTWRAFAWVMFLHFSFSDFWLCIILCYAMFMCTLTLYFILCSRSHC